MNHFSWFLVSLFITPAWCSEAKPESDNVALLQVTSNFHSGSQRSDFSQLSLLQDRLEEQDTVLKDQQVRLESQNERLEEQDLLLKDQGAALKAQEKQIVALLEQVDKLLSSIGLNGLKNQVD